MEALEFANLVKEHANIKVVVKVIKANPEQHKHVETVTVHIAGFQLEILRLRPLQYAQSSSSTVNKLVSLFFIKF
jgi:hypothetical protein